MGRKITAKTYQGRPCNKCGATERYECDYKCVRCKRILSKIRSKTEAAKVTAKLYRQSKKGKEAIRRGNNSEQRKMWLKNYVILDHVKKNRRYDHVKREYGLTKDQYDAMLEKTEGNCEICSTPVKEPHVDHDHTTGQIRGLLCFACNRLLGDASDNQEILKAAIAYLASYKLGVPSLPPPINPVPELTKNVNISSSMSALS